MIPILDPWSVLDLRPGASHDEVLNAYMRLRRVLRADSAALSPLECDAERRAELLAVEEAFRALSRNATLPVAAPRAATPGAALRPRVFTAAGRPIPVDQS